MSDHMVIRRRGRRAGSLALDPRTKILVIIVVSWVVLSTSGNESGTVAAIRWALISLPFILLVSAQLYGEAIRYAVTFAVLSVLPLLAWRFAPSGNVALDVFLMWLGAFSLILPGATCGVYALRTTTASEFLVSMQKIRCPDTINIPTAIVFRFFPTVVEEYRDIKSAMRMRGIGGLRQPLRMLEYRIVPLLVSVVSIGNELSKSAVTRALGSKRKRTSICEVKFKAIDGVAMLLLMACLCVVLAGKVW